MNKQPAAGFGPAMVHPPTFPDVGPRSRRWYFSTLPPISGDFFYQKNYQTPLPSNLCPTPGFSPQRASASTTLEMGSSAKREAAFSRDKYLPPRGALSAAENLGTWSRFLDVASCPAAGESLPGYIRLRAEHSARSNKPCKINHHY